MLDKNGVRIHAGDIVRVEGGFFKNDNGLFFIMQDGTNPGYLSNDTEVTMSRIGKNGKLSTAKYALAFFPLKAFCNDRSKREQARAWNAEHATIEVVGGVNKDHVVEYFREQAKAYRETEEHYNKRGYDWEYWGKQYAQTAKWHEDVVARMTA